MERYVFWWADLLARRRLFNVPVIFVVLALHLAAMVVSFVVIGQVANVNAVLALIFGALTVRCVLRRAPPFLTWALFANLAVNTFLAVLAHYL